MFARAKASHPCVLFFDELDSLAPARGKGGDGGGVLDRVVSQLLTELDLLHDHAAGAAAGIAHGRANGVFFVGATNRPDLLDPSLLRRGRLDVKMYLPPCRGPDDSVKILSAQTRAFVLSEDVDLRAVAESLPAHVTGADVSAASSGAYTIALRRKVLAVSLQWHCHYFTNLRRRSKRSGRSIGVALSVASMALSMSRGAYSLCTSCSLQDVSTL